jgi:hypothetical protein
MVTATGRPGATVPRENSSRGICVWSHRLGVVQGIDSMAAERNPKGMKFVASLAAVLLGSTPYARRLCNVVQSDGSTFMEH